MTQQEKITEALVAIGNDVGGLQQEIGTLEASGVFGGVFASPAPSDALPPKIYATFYLSTGGLTGQAATPQTLVVNQTAINSDPTNFVLSASAVTINRAGDYSVEFECFFNNQGTSRTEFVFWLEINNVEVAGTRTGNYQRGFDSGQTSGISTIVTVSAGDVLRARVARTIGSSNQGYQVDDGTRLKIVELG